MQRLDLFAQLVEGPIVDHEVIGDLTAAGIVDLRAHPGPSVVGVHPTFIGQPSQPRPFVRDDRDHRVEARCLPRLDQQRVVDQDQVVILRPITSGQFSDPLSDPSRDVRVGESIQVSSGCLIREGDRREGAAVQVAILLEDLVAEPVHQAGKGRTTRFHDLARDPIGVDDLGSELGEERGDGGLAAPDTTRQTDEVHAISLPLLGRTLIVMGRARHEGRARPCADSRSG